MGEGGSPLPTKKSGNIFRVGIFLDSVWLTTRTVHPHGAHCGGPDEMELTPHWGGIKLLATRTDVSMRKLYPCIPYRMPFTGRMRSPCPRQKIKGGYLP